MVVKLSSCLKKVRQCITLFFLLIPFSQLSNAIEKESNRVDPILGQDLDNNFVRDDVDIFINQHLGIKNEKLKKAFLNYAESVSLQLKYRFDKNKLKELDTTKSNDPICIMGLFLIKEPTAEELMIKVGSGVPGFHSNNPTNSLRIIEKIINEIHNNPSRLKAKLQVLETLEVTEFKIPSKKNWTSLCRN